MFYIIFRSMLLVVTMAEMYSTNHAVSYKLHVIKQTVNTINCNDYMLDIYSITQHTVHLRKAIYTFGIQVHLNKLECCGKVHLFQ